MGGRSFGLCDAAPVAGVKMWHPCFSTMIRAPLVKWCCGDSGVCGGCGTSAVCGGVVLLVCVVTMVVWCLWWCDTSGVCDGVVPVAGVASVDMWHLWCLW